MAVWMDMTNSLYAWRGGVVGIIRAELEIAKNLHKCDSQIRFSLYDGYKFVEIKAEKLEWLWNAENVGDAYLKAMGRIPSLINHEDTLLKEAYPRLAETYSYSQSRLHRLSHGLNLFLSTWPKWIGVPLKFIGKCLAFPLKRLSLLRARRMAKRQLHNAANAKSTLDTSFSYPYGENDIVFSCGWYTSGKESAFSRVKYELRHFTLVYLVYDIILLLPQTRCFYNKQASNDFLNYFKWISFNCDYILYGGKNAQCDSQKYQKKHGYPVPQGFPVKFGSDILKHTETDIIDQVRKKYKIAPEYLLMVGSLDMRKNYNTIYRAYTILLSQNSKESIPDLVIVGNGNACINLLNCIKRDPLTSQKIKIISPSDQELDALYTHCLFTLLASSYEGWSLTLPEALGYHKFCIVSDVLPLREVGEDFVEYVDTYDPFAWARCIKQYVTDRNLLQNREKKISQRWKSTSWNDCGKQIQRYLNEICLAEQEKKTAPTFYMDITTSWCAAYYKDKLGGILRTEIMLIHYLYLHKVLGNMKFFAFTDEFGYQPIFLSQLLDVLSDKNPTDAFNMSRNIIGMLHQNDSPNVNRVSKRKAQKADAFWYLCSVLPPEKQKKLILFGKQKKKQMNRKILSESGQDKVNDYGVPFQTGDVVFSAGTGHGEEADKELFALKQKIRFHYCQILYDLTPILLPQTHQIETNEMYPNFISLTSHIADLILYGGKTAQQDGIRYQKENNLPIPPSTAIKFGGDVVHFKELTEEKETKMLRNMGIKGPFVLTVGTCEARKNHETLYRAYLRLLKTGADIPQIVFAGNPGWNTGDFFNVLRIDDRVKDKILVFSPSDEQLDLLYQKCEFTLLPSLYEGWSLTLPESFQYGKFCIACDTPALREIGGDLIEYIHPWDEVQWAKRIFYYHTHPLQLSKAEERIKKEWKLISWNDCAVQVENAVCPLLEDKK